MAYPRRHNQGLLHTTALTRRHNQGTSNPLSAFLFAADFEDSQYQVDDLYGTDLLALRGPDFFTPFTRVDAPWTDNGDGSWTVDGSQGAAVDLRDITPAPVPGNTYEYKFTISDASGNLTVYTGNTGPVNRGNGDYTVTQLSNSAFFIFRAAAGVSATVRIHSVREVPATYTRSGSKYEPNSDGTIAGPFAANVPGITDEAYWARQGLTNLLAYSQQFDNAAWAKTGATVTANAIAAPDGTMTAEKIEETATTGVHYVNQGAVSTASVNHTSSIFVKAAERTLCEVWMISAAGTVGAGVRINLNDGSFVSQRSASTATYVSFEVKALPDGWYRVSVTANSSSTSIGLLVSPVANGTATSTLSYTGTAGSGIYVWQAQLVQASVPGPLIVTTGSPATVGEDNLSIAIDPLTDQDMLIFARGTVGDFAIPVFFMVSDGTNSNRILMFSNNSGTLTGVVTVAGTGVASQNLAGAISLGAEAIPFARRLGGQWRFGVSSGSTVTWSGADVTGAFPSALTKVNVGNDIDGGNAFRGTIEAAGILPGTFTTDAEVIAAITSV